jgi:uncharacterized protein YkuJ
MKKYTSFSIITFLLSLMIPSVSAAVVNVDWITASQNTPPTNMELNTPKQDGDIYQTNEFNAIIQTLYKVNNDDGNIGLGTVSPTVRLDVAGDTRVRGVSNCNGDQTIKTDKDGVLICAEDLSGGGGSDGVLSSAILLDQTLELTISTGEIIEVDLSTLTNGDEIINVEYNETNNTFEFITRDGDTITIDITEIFELNDTFLNDGEVVDNNIVLTLSNGDTITIEDVIPEGEFDGVVNAGTITGNLLILTTTLGETVEIDLSTLTNGDEIINVEYNETNNTLEFITRDGDTITIDITEIFELNDTFLNDGEVVDNNIVLTLSNGDTITIEDVIPEGEFDGVVNAGTITGNLLILTTTLGETVEIDLSTLTNGDEIINVEYNETNNTFEFITRDGDIITIDITEIFELNDTYITEGKVEGDDIVIIRSDETEIRIEDVITSGVDEDWEIKNNNLYTIPTGNVGIGTENPNAKLSVKENIAQNDHSTEPMAEIGNTAEATGPGSVAIGAWTKANTNYAVAIGNGSVASGTHATALGHSSTASSDYSIALGAESIASGERSAAFGIQAQAKGDISTAIGHMSWAEGRSATGIGLNAVAEGQESIMIATSQNQKFRNTKSNSLMLGAKTQTNEISVFLDGLTGRVGINTDMPTKELDVNGEVRIRTMNQGGDRFVCTDEDGFIYECDSNPGGSSLWSQNQDGVYRLDGNVGIGLVPDPKSDLVVGGDSREGDIVAFGYAPEMAIVNDPNLPNSINEAAIQFTLSNVSDWNMGVDGNDNNTFKIDNDFVMGANTLFSLSENSDVTIGQQTISQGGGAFAMGFQDDNGLKTQANAPIAFAFGKGVVADGAASLAFGDGSKTAGWAALAVGGGAQALGDVAIALGDSVIATGRDAVAIGGYSTATGTHSKAIGYGAHARAEGSFALGSLVGTGTAAQNALSIGMGNDENKRIINNKADSILIGVATKNQDSRIFLDGLTGRVGINTDMPTKELDVNGEVRIRNMNQGGDRFVCTDEDGFIYECDSNPGGSSLWSQNQDGVYRLDGNVGIGSAPDPKSDLVVGSDSREGDIVAVGFAPEVAIVNVNQNGDASVQLGNASKNWQMSMDGSDNKFKIDNDYRVGQKTIFSLSEDSDVTIGLETIAQGGNAFAMGFTDDNGLQTQANAPVSFAFGKGVVADGAASLAFGDGSKTAGWAALAVGGRAKALGDVAIALGDDVTATGRDAIAIGAFVTANGTHAKAIGYGAHARAEGTFALGSLAETGDTSENTMTIGMSNGMTIRNDKTNSILIGSGTQYNQATILLNGQNGNIGIGTNNPQAKLDVNGSIAVNGVRGLTQNINLTGANGNACTLTVRGGIITATNCQ